ncbi:CAP domain-containing protein [Ruminococcus albus]|uniref:SCP domain-containing protein n=1 Tax=Ruminococcus albus (strain ATCC 27210 / DSM 20455 / JCM 14654 / NCDO 2250 / 7) TaxID=697329 RepID=E6UJE2_RUMA7|nr:CAP domain-containing protein [Ruminococcus albus]ADU23788.1 hypothetical protein Rumal_3326 [Ruminococcus albus 7 = DSM 20455]
MNKIVILFVFLFCVFCALWVFKSKTPINRHLNESNNASNWWDTQNDIAPLSYEVSEEWYLDPRIPSDYVPVLGEDGLYMQVDENGTILSYWKCTEDGTALNWEKVNPDIPDNYEAVEDLEDVYKVTDANGMVKYLKYIRNRDNSFTFVEVDKYGNIIDEYITSCESQAGDNSIPTNYMQIDGNIYGVKNKDGVVVEYVKKNEDKNGNLIWNPISEEKVFADITGNERNNGEVKNPDMTLPDSTDQKPDEYVVGKPGGNKVTTAPVVVDPDISVNTGSKSKKTHTQKESYQTTEYEGDYKLTYEYTIIKTYDDEGNMLSSDKQGPFLRNKEYVGNQKVTANPSLIESNLDNEIMRVAGALEQSDASGVINSLNAERINNNLSILATDGDAQKIATLFAADMATYDNTTNISPLYGSIDQLMTRYGITNQGYGLNVWRTTSDDAQQIHQRFQSIDNCRNARMNENFNQVGVAIFKNNGYYYVAELLMLQF